MNPTILLNHMHFHSFCLMVHSSQHFHKNCFIYWIAAIQTIHYSRVVYQFLAILTNYFTLITFRTFYLYSLGTKLHLGYHSFEIFSRIWRFSLLISRLFHWAIYYSGNHKNALLIFFPIYFISIRFWHFHGIFSNLNSYFLYHWLYTPSQNKFLNRFHFYSLSSKRILNSIVIIFIINLKGFISAIRFAIIFAPGINAVEEVNYQFSSYSFNTINCYFKV